MCLRQYIERDTNLKQYKYKSLLLTCTVRNMNVLGIFPFWQQQAKGTVMHNLFQP